MLSRVLDYNRPGTDKETGVKDGESRDKKKKFDVDRRTEKESP